MTDSGYNLVPSEYVQQIDLQAIRNDYARGNDLAPQTLRAMVQAVKAANLTYVVLGTMDVGMVDVDPVTGNKRVYVSINARLLDLSGAYPRPVAAIGPAQYSGPGPRRVGRPDASDEDRRPGSRQDAYQPPRRQGRALIQEKAGAYK